MPKTMKNEIEIPLPWGGTLRCGEGDSHQHGGYVRVCDAKGKEVVYWDKQEWADEPESVMGAMFRAAMKVKA